MNLYNIQKRFDSKESCFEYLENLRWNGTPICPHCESINVKKRSGRKFYYHCNKCKKDFTVLYGTIFESSKLPLEKWFMLIGLMLNARKGISAMEIHRNLGVTYKTAWYSAMRVRCAMIDEVGMLEGIVEMDEAYLGGKPRHRSAPSNKATLSNLTFKRGRGTKKVPIVGMVERGKRGRVVTEVAGKLNTKSMLELLHKYVNTEKTIMMTDDARFYHKFENELQHLIINHSKKQYVNGIIHTNTIEGFWSIVKNGIRGEFHVLSRKYLPFYLAEFAYKYNRRDKEQKAVAFEETVSNAVTDDKCLTDYKPKGDVSEIAYGEKAREEPTSKPNASKRTATKSKKRNNKKTTSKSKRSLKKKVKRK